MRKITGAVRIDNAQAHLRDKEKSRNEKIFNELIKEEDIKASVYLQLVELANQQGKLDESIYFDSVLIQNYPRYRSSYFKEQMHQVHKCKSTIDSLNKIKIPADKKLFEIGSAYYELFKMVKDLPGSIAEVGVFIGNGLFTWTKLLETFNPGKRGLKAYGFDNFSGYTKEVSDVDKEAVAFEIINGCNGAF